MNDRRKTKAQLLDELAGLRQQVADLQYRLTDQHPDRPLPLNVPSAGHLHTVEPEPSSDLRFRALIENAPGAIALLGVDGRVTFASASTERVLGYPLDEFVGRDPAHITYPEDLPALLMLLADLMQQPGQIVTTEYRYLHYNGSVRWVQSTITNLFTEPTVQALVFNFQDITSRKLTEVALANKNLELEAAVQQLEHSRTVLQSIISAIPVRVFWKDMASRYLGCNDQFARDAGLESAAQLIGQDDFALGWREQAELYRQDDREVLDSGQPKLDIIEPQTTPIGDTIWLKTSKVPLVDSAGRIYGLVGVYEDITDRKQAEQALRESEEKYRSLIDSQESAISTLDADGVFHYINRIGAAPFALAPEDVVGRKLHDLFPPPVADWQLSRAREVIASGQSLVTEHQIVVAGQLRWRRISIQPIRNATGQITLAMVNSLDIHERKLAEQRVQYLTRLYATLSQVNQTIVRITDRQQLFDTICQIAVDYGEFKFAWIGQFDRDTGQVTQVAEHGLEDGGFLRREFNIHQAPYRSGAIAAALLNGQVQTDDNVLHNPRAAQWVAQAEQLGYRSYAAIPIHQQSQVVAVLNLYATDTDFFAAEEERKLLAEMGLDISFALDMMYRETERQQFESALQRSETQYRYLFENNPHPMWAYDLETLRFLAVNDAAIEKYGYSRAEFENMTLFDIRPADEFDRLKANLTQPRTALQHSDGWKHKLKDGTIIDVEISSHTLNLAERPAALVVAREVTDRKRAEEALAASEEKYRGLLESLDSVIALIDADGRFWYMNEIGARALGATPDRIVGQTMADLFPEPVASLQLGLIRQAIQEDRSFVHQTESVIQGQPRWYRSSIQPIHDETGRVVQALLNTTDITPLMTVQVQLEELNHSLEERVTQRTQELAAANERLTELDKLKSKFVSDVSHELRTPVTSLSVYIDLLEHGKPEKREHYVKQLKEQMARLHKLINDILDLSRLERDRDEGGRSPVDINSIVEHVTAMERGAAEAAGLTLICDVADGIPPVVARADQLTRAITNLVSNAIKYTPHGTVRVETCAVDQKVCIEVIDTGLGIPADELPHLFGRFYRGRAVAQSTIPGTGLGLSIVKEIVEMQGGTVEVESTLGSGSTFRVWLPAAS